MSEPGLRERKKARTRAVIAGAAARLFAERGYEQVSVADVAREADVSEQTVYNYFQTKEQLVTDRDEPVQEALCRAIRERAPGVTPAAAIRPIALDSVDGIERVPADQWRGELGPLAAISPTVRRLLLEMSARQTDALTDAIEQTTVISSALAQLEALAIAGIFQIVIREAGERTRAGEGQARIAAELRPVVEELVDELDRWFALTPRAPL